jgi:DNA-directed RNA polymerase subunit RPC12/RpoP
MSGFIEPSKSIPCFFAKNPSQPVPQADILAMHIGGQITESDLMRHKGQDFDFPVSVFLDRGDGASFLDYHCAACRQPMRSLAIHMGLAVNCPKCKGLRIVPDARPAAAKEASRAINAHSGQSWLYIGFGSLAIIIAICLFLMPAPSNTSIQGFEYSIYLLILGCLALGTGIITLYKKKQLGR